MFSISKNPQASMDEVLSKIEKYINGEEALLSKRENSSVQNKKSRGEKSENEAPEDEKIEIDPHEGTKRTENGLQRYEATSVTAWAHHNPSSNDIYPGNSTPSQSRCHRSFTRRNTKSF